MPERELSSEIRAVDWRGLESTYGSGEVVRDIVLGLADTYFFRDDLKRLANDLPVYPENWYAAGAMYSRCATS